MARSDEVRWAVTFSQTTQQFVSSLCFSARNDIMSESAIESRIQAVNTELHSV